MRVITEVVRGRVKMKMPDRVKKLWAAFTKRMEPTPMEPLYLCHVVSRDTMRSTQLGENFENRVVVEGFLDGEEAVLVTRRAGD